MRVWGLGKVSLAIMASSMAMLLCACDNQANALPKSNSNTTATAQKAKEALRISGETFGTFYYITVPDGYPGGETTLRNDAEFVFKKVSDAISTFDPNAEIARFNKFDKTTEFPISQYLATVIEEVQRQALRIDCAMDPTVGPLVNLWGFGPEGKVEKAPTEEQINATKKIVGLDKIALRRAGNSAFLVKTDPQVKLDLSTIGEGLAADELASLMDEKGIANYMIAVAGAIRSKGANPEGKLWRVGIEDPLSQGQQVYTAVCPQDMAISTAGSYRNFFVDKDTNSYFTHIIDPKTGRPINHRTLSISVIGRAALITDALDTGLLVMGAKEAVAWGEANDVPVYAIELSEDGKAVATYTRTFEKYLKCQVVQGLTPSTVESKDHVQELSLQK